MKRLRIIMMSIIAAGSLLAMAACSFVSASNESGRIEGKTLDEMRNPLPEVVIVIAATTATDSYPEIAPVSNEEGKFNFPDLPPGRYTLRASVKGYKSETQPVDVQAGKTAQVEFVMKK